MKIKTFFLNRVQKHKNFYTITPFLYTTPRFTFLFYPIFVHNTPFLYTIFFLKTTYPKKYTPLLPYFSTRLVNKTTLVNPFAIITPFLYTLNLKILNCWVKRYEFVHDTPFLYTIASNYLTFIRTFGV